MIGTTKPGDLATQSAQPVPPDPQIAEAGRRPAGPGNTVWLASYPKSGNTWMRAILAGLNTHAGLFQLSDLRSGAQPYRLMSDLRTFGLDSRWLDRGESRLLRHSLVWERGKTGVGAAIPVFRKTHEVWRAGGPGAEPFPTAVTRAALLITRDPRDVVGSYASFFGISTERAVETMTTGRASRPQPSRLVTEQPIGSWDQHTRSWLGDDVPFPVHLIRYEDLQTDAVAALHPVLQAVGLTCSTDELAVAVTQASFDRLRRAETERGFRETHPAAPRFFREGRTGSWRADLADELVLDIEADLGPVMTMLGYPCHTAERDRRGRADIRQSRRRQQRNQWTDLPADLGIDVTVGELPDELPEARSPRPWLRTTATQTLVRFGNGSGLWVRDGRQVTVSPPPDDGSGDDPSWLVHGWAVTIAFLQRGSLSLHAATVELCHDDGRHEVVAIAGHRGAGKSTTSMALRQAGHRLLVDDVTLLDLRDDGAFVLPYSRNVHLLPDAAEALGLDFDLLPLLAGGRTKAAFRPEDPDPQPRRIDRIVVLAPSRHVEDVQRADIIGTDKVPILMRHTGREGLAAMVLGHERLFARVTTLAAATPLSVIRRPRDPAATPWTLPTVIAEILGP